MTYPGEADVEAPEADAAEQAMSAVPDRYEEDDEAGRTFDIEAPDWDVQEQGRIVDFEDEYR